MCGEGKPGKRLAEQVKVRWDAFLALGQVEQVFTPNVAPVPVAVASDFPKLRDAVPEWIERQETSGDLRGATPSAYLGGCRTWVFEHALPDGRLLGDLPVNQVTREHLGAIIAGVKAAGRSISTVEHIRNPLRGYYRELIETKVLTVNPAGDLGFFVGRMKRKKRVEFFTEQEGVTLIAAAKVLYPRWPGFIMTGLLAGLRWGEIAGLRKTDVDFERGRIHVQRSWSPKARAIQDTKNGKDRYVDVKASPALLDALRAQMETATLEAQAAGWKHRDAEVARDAEPRRKHGAS